MECCSYSVLGCDNILINDVVLRGTVIPKGFCSDAASVPWLARRMLPSHDEPTPALVLHDYLYSTRGPREVTREDADLYMYHDLLEMGVSLVRAKAIFAITRATGSRLFRPRR